MENERWLPIAGWEGLYEVSDHGRVRSLGHTATFFCPQAGRVITRRKGGRVLTPTWAGRYAHVKLSRPGQEPVHRAVHLIVLATFGKPKLTGQQARHLDGDRANCALDNLVWGTAKENADDKRRHGTIVRGEQHALAKIKEADVIAIRAARGKVRQIDLAETYGIHQTKISAIQRGELWKHVPCI